MSATLAPRALYLPLLLPDLPPPGNQAQLKIHYPAQSSADPQGQDSGLLPMAESDTPCPVVIFMAGAHCHSEYYSWLGQRLAAQGIVMVSYSLIAEELPGQPGLSPGIDLARLQPDTFGQGPSALALPPLLGCLADLNRTARFNGMLDLQQLVLGGHSAGGTLALLNANPDWFPGVTAAFSYAAHTAAATRFGWPEDTLLATGSRLPILIMGGDRDGVIAASSARYGAEKSPTRLLQRCFNEAVCSARKDCYLAIIRGANHGSIQFPLDASSGRSFLDWPAEGPAAMHRDLIVNLLTHFIDAHVRGKAAAANRLRAFLRHNPLLALTGCK